MDGHVQRDTDKPTPLFPQSAGTASSIVRAAQTSTSINPNLSLMCYRHFSGRLQTWPVILLAKGGGETQRLQKASHDQWSLFS